MALTNSVIAPLPSAMEVDAAKVAFESFGEVFRVKRLEKFNNFVQVIFYDVRSAAAALKAFGEAGCIPGPQVGERTVKLAGDDQLSTKDFQNISEVLKSKDGTFFLEFYDIRDAMRYRTPKEKATIDLPPGLPAKEPLLRAPPGLTAVSDWQVVLGHLPAKLLTEVMLEAVFQQAGLELLHFTVKNDKVLVHFENQINAQKCVAHFSGCQWDKSGTLVTAEMISPEDAKPSFGTAANGSKGLSAEAPAFQPYAPFYSDFSAEAPAFVPSWNPGLPKVVEEAAEGRQRAPGKLAFGSDTSTEVGDSEDDEKNSPARVKCSLSKPMGARARSGSAGSV